MVTHSIVKMKKKKKKNQSDYNQIPKTTDPACVETLASAKETASHVRTVSSSSVCFLDKATSYRCWRNGPGHPSADAGLAVRYPVEDVEEEGCARQGGVGPGASLERSRSAHARGWKLE